MVCSSITQYQSHVCFRSSKHFIFIANLLFVFSFHLCIFLINFLDFQPIIILHVVSFWSLTIFYINLNLYPINFEMLELYAVSLSIHFIWGYNFVISELYEVWMCVYCLKCLISSHKVYGEEGDVNWFCCRGWESVIEKAFK